MIRKVFSYLLLISSLSLLPYVYCSAQIVSSSGLINDAKDYDGKTVSYSGEIIGDIMIRKDYAWINVNDGKNAIGIWATKDLIKDLHYAGSYNAIGDSLEVTGIFHRSCLEHGGDLDIHAKTITKMKSGSIVLHKLNYKLLKIAGGLSCALVLVWLLRMLLLRKPWIHAASERIKRNYD
ncbi:MAG: DNA-binding protein [Candidatus Omnitrophota bacterium]